MSKCVVRMEMPQKCFNCDLRYECNAFYAPGHPKPFMKGCRIVCQLPEGHGRLVDADALKEWFIEQIDYYKRFDGPNCSMMVSAYEAVCRVINDAPTIVPAERSETCLD